MHVEPHHTGEELAILAGEQDRVARWRRLRAVIPAREGRTAEAISDALGCTPRAVQKWVARYNRGGAKALADRPGRGRKPKLSPEQDRRLRDRVEAGPTEADGVRALHGPDIRRILRDEFGLALCQQAVYDTLHRLGLSSLMPRPIHRKADPEAQEAFQKKLPRTSGR
jgi:transposase